MTEISRYKKILSQTLSHSFIFFVFLLCLAAWALLMAYLMKFLPQAQLPGAFADPASFKLPVTAADLGSAMAIVQGLFSAIAIILGLFAIILQGRDLRLSARAQTDQAEALQKQIKHQDESAAIAYKTAQLHSFSIMLAHHNDIRNSYLDSIRDVERRIASNDPFIHLDATDTEQQRQELEARLRELQTAGESAKQHADSSNEINTIRHQLKLMEYREEIANSRVKIDEIMEEIGKLNSGYPAQPQA